MARLRKEHVMIAREMVERDVPVPRNLWIFYPSGVWLF